MEIFNEIPKMNLADSETGCCPKFHPLDWDGKVFNFENMQFAKAETKSMFYVPLNMGAVMKDTMKKIEDSQAGLEDGYLILSRDISKWKCEHRFLVKGKVNGCEMVTVNGNYMAKVYDGPFQDMPKWMNNMEEYVEQRGMKMKNYFSFYTTCPKCAKHYGNNYVVMFAEI